uniref:Uncharacterized protein n=1 Tax=viral metagenome TaxID=1070528 RepID=A0A6M3LYN7_9ZZZZ
MGLNISTAIRITSTAIAGDDDGEIHCYVASRELYGVHPQGFPQRGEGIHTTTRRDSVSSTL